MVMDGHLLTLKFPAGNKDMRLMVSGGIEKEIILHFFDISLIHNYWLL